MNDWVVTHTFDSGRLEDLALEGLSTVLGHVDGSASGGNGERWYTTMHVQADGAVPAAARAEALLTSRGVEVERAIDVEVATFDEYERKAWEPTIPVLVGAAEVGELLGVSRQRVHQLGMLDVFPRPLVRVRMGPLWDRRAIETFDRGWKRAPGRPAAPKHARSGPKAASAGRRSAASV